MTEMRHVERPTLAPFADEVQDLEHQEATGTT